MQKIVARSFGKISRTFMTQHNTAPKDKAPDAAGASGTLETRGAI